MWHRSHKSVIPSFHRAQTVVPLAFWYSWQCFSTIVTTVLSTASSSLLNSCPKDRMWLSFARTIFVWCINAKLRHFWDVLHKPQFHDEKIQSLTTTLTTLSSDRSQKHPPREAGQLCGMHTPSPYNPVPQAMHYSAMPSLNSCCNSSGLFRNQKLLVHIHLLLRCR